MAVLHHRRQIALFIAAVVFPSAVLVALGVRMIGQERELAGSRLAVDRRRAIADVRQALISELERIKVEALSARATTDGPFLRSYDDSAVRLVAPVEDGRVVLPWETDARAKAARVSLAEPAFAETIGGGERAELGQRDFTRAIDAYREAIREAQNGTQVSHGRLLLARALSGAGRNGAAREEYRFLLESPLDIVDDYGVPFALYAAGSLIDAGTDLDVVERRLRQEVDSPLWRPPTALYLLRDLLARLMEEGSDAAVHDAASHMLEQLAREIHRVEHALQIQREFPMLRLRYRESEAGSAPSPWVALGDGEWLVTTASSAGTDAEAVIAVSVSALFRFVSESNALHGPAAQAAELRVGADAGGEPLGPSLPDLKVAFLEPREAALAREVGLRRSFYLAALVLVLSIALFGGYLLWRDVQRELRLARLRSDFVSSVSHELKTPLTSIRMFAETLRIRERPEPNMQAEYLDTIVGESERLTRLLNNVLDLSKIEQDQKVYRREQTSLTDVANRAARAVEYQLTQERFQLNIDIRNGMPPMSVDADAVEQAILNLLTNAVKYSGESRDIDLRLRTEDGYAVIDVTDHGVGIPAEVQARLTEKFYRVRSAENERIPGTGLGLTIVEHTARAHGGHLTIASAVGNGSTFSIHLPLEDHA
jgi:signal transduction histidine kinase